MTAIDGVWDDDFAFDTNGETGWYLFWQESKELDETYFTGSTGTNYYGPMVGTSSGKDRHIVEFCTFFNATYHII